MKIQMNWALFLLTASSYVLYPVWHVPLPAAGQWALLNSFVLLSIAVLYSPLGEVSLEASLPELKELWPAALFTAAACLPFWLLPLPVGGDEQSHAGTTAWFLGRAASGLGLRPSLFPLFGIPALAAAVFALKGRLRLPGRGAAALALAAAGNLYFLASARFGLADAAGRFETILRYPPLSKFLYAPAYLLLGLNEAAPRTVQFLFLALTAVCMLRMLRYLKAEPPAALTYLLIAWFPTFFYLSTTSELEAGTVFFFTISIYHFIKAAKTGEKAEFLKCAFWTAASLLYKQLPLGLMVSFLPALAWLRVTRPERAAAWRYGLLSIAIPAAVGLPFIILSAAYGIRNTGLIASYLTDPAMMLLTLKNISWTCGPVLAALLLLSSAYAAYRHRGLEILLLLYFAAAYYVMISATEAVGYIRHAQPFYIAPVFLLALWLSDLPKMKFRGGEIRPAYLLLLPLLVYQTLFAKDHYQRRTVSDPYPHIFPYEAAVDYLKGLGGPLPRIYAPAEVEPSHFYLAKAGLAGKMAWDRTLPPDFSAEKAARAFAAGSYDFMLLPDSPYPWTVDFESIAEKLKASGSFSEVKSFDYHGNKLVLLKPSIL